MSEFVTKTIARFPLGIEITLYLAAFKINLIKESASMKLELEYNGKIYGESASISYNDIDC